MSFLGLFGGDSSSTTNAITNTTSQDQRTAVGGSVGSLVSPGAAVGTPGGGAVVAAPGATISQTNSVTGLTGPQVQGLLDTLTETEKQASASIANLGGSLAAGLQNQSQTLGQIVAATKTPDANLVTQLMPLAVIGLVVWAVTRRKDG